MKEILAIIEKQALIIGERYVSGSGCPPYHHGLTSDTYIHFDIGIAYAGR